MDGDALWTLDNSTFESAIGTKDYHGWEKGICFESDPSSEGMECFTFEICEDNGCMGDQGLDTDDDWTHSYVFDGVNGDTLLDWGDQENNTVSRRGLDWDDGDGVVTLIGGGLGGGLYTKNMDFVGDSRMEIVELEDDQMVIHVSAVENDARYLAPLYDPNTFKPMTQHANGGYTYTSAAHTTMTYVLACEVGPIRLLEVTAGERAELICGLGSQLGFEGTVSLSSITDLEGVQVTYGPQRQDSMDIEMGAGETILFRVFVDVDESTELGNTRFRIIASGEGEGFSLARRIIFVVTVQ
jgi:hypothetical protein